MFLFLLCSNTPPHHLGEHVNVKRPFRTAGTVVQAATVIRDSAMNQNTTSAMNQTAMNRDSAMNRSYSQDSTVNGGGSGPRSSSMNRLGGLMSRSLMQEAAVGRRSIDESLALIQHHVQVKIYCTVYCTYTV